jgi:glycosyltransferase involved in cell wall biosynthesis
MNICFISKYPPIQGGVSMHCYWAARGLAQRGHKVFVVTNANEVESTFRIHLFEDDRVIGGEYARAFPESGGSVNIYSTEPPDRSKMYYIPMNNPTVTRLATVATNLIRAEECKVIFSYYLEPYGLAAHLASHWTGIPYVFKHAGSDLYRLLRLEDLQSAYLEVIARANRVISGGRSIKQLLSYGLSEDRIASNVAFGLPTQYFHPDAPSLDINDLQTELAESDLTDGHLQRRFQPLKRSLPVLGIYGKLGEYKGSFDLIYAMAQLIQNGFPFYLVALSHGWQEQRFRRLIDELEIAEFIRFLPFLPHWKVPGFIRACTAVAFLERDFPITAHTPTIPTEIVACGKCLVLSEEVARKQLFRSQIRNLQNIVIVPDPKRHESLAACLRFALENPQRAEEIGQRGFHEFGVGRPHEKYIDRLESLLIEVAAEEPTARKLVAQATEPRVRRDVIEMMDSLFPFTHALLTERQKERIRVAIAGTSLGSGIEDRTELAVSLGHQLLSALTLDENSDVSPVYEVCRYEYKLHEWGKGSRLDKEVLGFGISFSMEELQPLSASIRGNIEIVEFSYDVEEIASAIEAEEGITQTRNRVKVLFHSGSVPMRINDATELLLGLLAEGSMTMGEVFKVLLDCYQCGDQAAEARLIESSLSVLEGLYWEGIVAFGPASPTEGEHAAEIQEREEKSYG